MIEQRNDRESNSLSPSKRDNKSMNSNRTTSQNNNLMSKNMSSLDQQILKYSKESEQKKEKTFNRPSSALNKSIKRKPYY